MSILQFYFRRGKNLSVTEGLLDLPEELNLKEEAL